eukprot:6211932-Pleurochrysis_carterae.AAC.1
MVWAGSSPSMHRVEHDRTIRVQFAQIRVQFAQIRVQVRRWCASKKRGRKQTASWAAPSFKIGHCRSADLATTHSLSSTCLLPPIPPNFDLLLLFANPHGSIFKSSRTRSDCCFDIRLTLFSFGSFDLPTLPAHYTRANKQSGILRAHAHAHAHACAHAHASSLPFRLLLFVHLSFSPPTLLFASAFSLAPPPALFPFLVLSALFACALTHSHAIMHARELRHA